MLDDASYLMGVYQDLGRMGLTNRLQSPFFEKSAGNGCPVLGAVLVLVVMFGLA